MQIYDNRKEAKEDGKMAKVFRSFILFYYILWEFKCQLTKVGRKLYGGLFYLNFKEIYGTQHKFVLFVRMEGMIN